MLLGAARLLAFGLENTWAGLANHAQDRHAMQEEHCLDTRRTLLVLVS